MRKTSFIIFIAAFVVSCTQQNNTSKNSADKEAIKKEVAQAEENMFNDIKNNTPGFWNTVSDSYITINADGVMANKTETIADSVRRKMFIGVDHKLFDHNIKVFDNIGICNGRAQFVMNGQMAAEVYYTAIFRKENDKWLFENWQGTLTKAMQEMMMKQPQQTK